MTNAGRANASRANGRYFSDYARTHGHPKLADETVRAVKQNVAVILSRDSLEAAPRECMGVSAPLVRRIVGSWNTARACFAQLFFLLTALGALSLTLLLQRPRPAEALRSHDMVALLTAGGLLNAVCVVLLLNWAPGAAVYVGDVYFCGMATEDSAPINVALSVFALHPLVLLPMLILCATEWRKARWRRENPATMKKRPTPWRGYGALWLRRVWALHLALACWTWFLLLALSLPARHAADAQFEEFLRRPDLRGAGHTATLP